MSAPTNSEIFPKFAELLANLNAEPSDSDEDQQYSGKDSSNDEHEVMMMNPGSEERIIPLMFEVFDFFNERLELFPKNQEMPWLAPLPREFINIAKIISNVAINCDKYDKDYLYANFIPRFSAFFNHPKVFLREYAAKTISKLAKCFGTQFTEKCIIPHLVNLSEDEDKSVRDICSRQYAEVAGCCSSQMQHQLTTNFVEFISKESENNPKCAKELGRFISTFADSKKTGLIMRNGEIINLNRKRRTHRRNRFENRKVLSSTSSSLQIGQLNEVPPDPEVKSSCSSLQIRSPKSNKSISDNETSSLRDSFLKYSSSTSSSHSESSLESDDDIFSIEDLPMPLTPLSENSKFSEIPQGFQMPSKPKDEQKNLFSLFKNSGTELEWSPDPQIYNEFDDGSDEEDAINSSFMHDEDIEFELEDPLPSPTPRLQLEELDESCSLIGYWSSAVNLEDADIEEYERKRKKPTKEIKYAKTEQSFPRVSSGLDEDMRELLKLSFDVDTDETENVSQKQGSFTDRKQLFALADERLLDRTTRITPITNPSKSIDSFWPKGFLQKTTESMKKTTVAALQSTEEITTRASSALLSKLRLPPVGARFLSPSPRKLYQSQFPVVERMPERPSIIGPDGIKRFLTEEEREIVLNISQDVIPQELIDTLILIQRKDYKEKDSLRHLSLAESFPAIVYTFGPKYWIYIKAIYMSFCVHENQQVRMKMAQSLHQIAQILGPKLAERDLCPLFQQFSRDTTEIQQALLKNLFSFIKALPQQSRQKLGADLIAFNTHEVNAWRLKHEFIEQLTKLVTLYKPYEINDFLVPFALTFSADKIAEIRLGAINMVASILAVFIKYERSACIRSGISLSSPNSMPLSEKFLEDMQKGFWKSQNWRRRQRQYFCRIAQLIGQPKLESIDHDLFSLVRSRLHQMAANDSDLEIRMMARVILGTMDKVKNEVDLGCRVSQSELTAI